MSWLESQAVLGQAPAGWQWGTFRRDHCGLAPPSAEPALILKVGGSLLSRPGWPALLASLVAACGQRSCRLVVGGGAVVDGLRTLDTVAPQPAALMHALAIDALRLTGRLVAETLAVPMVAAVEDGGCVAVLDIPAWLGVQSRSATLPMGWEVTSDAIAAQIAVEHGGQLMLVKSVPPPPCPGGVDCVSALAAAGWVDQYFPRVAEPLAVIEWAAPSVA